MKFNATKLLDKAKWSMTKIWDGQEDVADVLQCDGESKLSKNNCRME